MSVSAYGTPATDGGVISLVKDGTASITLGSLIAGGFGVEAAKSIMAGESAGRVAFFVAFGVGLVLVAVGFGWRSRRRRRTRVGVVVVAADTPGLARQREQQAETFSGQECALTLTVSMDLPDDPVRRRELMSELVAETQQAISTAERLTPDAARINLIPIMRLQMAFWFGARLGYTHPREVAVYSLRQGTGSPAFFHATNLRAVRSRKQPLTVAALETVPGADPARVALALDLQNRGQGFHDQVLQDCRARGVGTLLLLRNPRETLPENTSAFTAVVDQVCRVWRKANLPAGARSSGHTIYLSGPVSIAVALGARLAAADQSCWTALSYDTATGNYMPFPEP